MTQKLLLEKIEKQVDNIWKILSGNGQPGLCEITRDQDRRISELEENENDRKKQPDKIGQWVVRIIMAMIAMGQLIIAYKFLIQGVK